eukprot:TRINITY_DN3703_c1_g1_i3.p1 TRINITY_DN3703_c1_g1~~TRINITY_DN3703_c1_g1_i3.p1  ORF type:complete len:246 (-),score=37.76 TRINITY_DN3703_c1_g1_i3:116-853(-)
MIKTEGITSGWKGLSPALIRSFTYSSLRLSSFDFFKQMLEKGGLINNFINSIISGAGAGAFASLVANPVEVIKVRMQADKITRRYTGFLNAFFTITKEERLGGLCKGVVPHMQRSAIWAMIQFSTYTESKNFILKYIKNKESILVHFSASLICCFCTCMGAHPWDVVKSRLMNQNSILKKGASSTQNVYIYKSTFDCFLKTFQKEGFLALYKGVIPNYMRSTVHGTLLFIIYEQTRKLFGLNYMK